MRPMSLTTQRRKYVAAMVAGVMALATVGGALAENKNSTVKIAFTPKFLKDDFQTLMLKLSKKAFAEKGFTVVGAPDPNGDIAAQVDHSLVREVVWELSVSNFRLELLDLDRTLLDVVYNHQDSSLAARRESLVCQIWQNGCICPAWERSIDCDRLSAPAWDVRLPAVKQLAYIISAWPGGERFKSWNDSFALNGAVFSRYEYDVFLFYARTFSKIRGRRPILPLIQPNSLVSRTV